MAPPIAPPIAPKENATTPAPGADVIAPAVVVPTVAAGLAIFLGVYFGKKKQAEKAQKNGKDSEDVESNTGTSVAMTGSANATGVAPSAYGTVPSNISNARASGQYNSLPEGLKGDESDVGASDINPIGINPAEIDKRMHIPYKSLVFTKEIGAGSYGKVFLG